jgi:Kef-type K+ transport system membrane component KefB
MGMHMNLYPRYKYAVGIPGFIYLSSSSPKTAPAFLPDKHPLLVSSGLLAVLIFSCPVPAWASGGALATSLGLSVITATVLAALAYLTRQPLILAYIAAGAAIGPQFGLGLVHDNAHIQIIGDIGLILLLFMIGLELDLKKLRESGSSLVVTGVSQFILCVAMGLGFFLLLGFTIGEPYEYRIFGVKVLGGEYDLIYLSVCFALSSTTIVVKLLYDKFEIGTLAGRLTLGILVFQDLWAIVVLSLQPSLANPQFLGILWRFGQAGLLVVVALLLSKYALGFFFRQIARLPELVLVASLGWCFCICGIAGYMGLSLEMGALIAGAAISTFPYHLDIIAKIINIRDFFIVLFFVALGMEIPNPWHHLGMLKVAAAGALFLMATRFLSVYPVLYLMKNGHRVSLLTSINLCQMSEFALVITALGLKNQHIVPDIQTIIIFTFAITSVASTYMIKYSHQLQHWLSQGLSRLGLKDVGRPRKKEIEAEPKDIAILGFFRAASAFLGELERSHPEVKDRLVVVDFNPQVFQELQRAGVKVIYGDISNTETLHYAGLDQAKVIVSTVPDEVLVGTSNLNLVMTIRSHFPQAKIVVTAETPARAVPLYEAGADYVCLPNRLVAGHLIPVVRHLVRDEKIMDLQEELETLKLSREVLP